MKNRLFLTSMLAVMIACPAVGFEQCINALGDCGTIAQGETSADCNSDPLTYDSQSPNYGTYTLTAQWDPDICPITLNPNNGNTEFTGGASTNQNQIIYSRYGAANDSDAGAYKTNTSGVLSDKMSSIANNVTPPIGADVTFSFNVTMPNGYSGTAPTVSSLTGTRVFAGYYDTATAPGSGDSINTWLQSATRLINSTGHITSDGTDEARGIAKEGDPIACPSTVWKAYYNCPTSGSFPAFPTVTGYHVTSQNWTDGSTTVAPSGTLAMCEDKTFTVSYAADQYDVIYQTGSGNDACSGSSTTRSNVLTYDVAPNYSVESISNTTVTEPTGWEFDYWSVAGDNNTQYHGGDTYGASTPWTTNGDLVFVAHCKRRTCTVTYNPTAHSVNPSATAVTDTATYGLAYSVPNSAAELSVAADGYTFVGWTEDSTPTFTNNSLDNEWTWSDGDTWTGITCPTVYAAYTANSYNVTYDCDVGSDHGTLSVPNGHTNPESVTFGQPYTFWNTNVCTLAGKTNNAWKCVVGPNINGTEINQAANASSWAIASDVTCFAQYNANMVDLIWKYDNDGVTNDQTTSCNYGAGNIVFPSVTPTKVGHTFTGWKVTYWE